MELYLKVVSFDDKYVDYDLSASIGAPGGSIGRAAQNNLILPDEEGYISRVHATIDSDGGRFYITDCSSNGTLLLELIPDDVEEAYNEVMIHQDKRELLDGYYIIIGQFEIEVQILADSSNSNNVQDLGNSQATIESTPSRDSIPVQQEFKQPVFTNPPIEEENNKAYEFQSVDVSAMQHQFTVPEVKAPVEAIEASVEQAANVGNIEPEAFNIDDFFGGDNNEKDQIADKTGNDQAFDNNEEDDIFAGFQDPFAEPVENKQISSETIQAEDQSVIVEEPLGINANDLKDADAQSLKVDQNLITPVAESSPSVTEEPAPVPAPVDSYKKESSLSHQVRADKAVEPEQFVQTNNQAISEAFFKGLGLNINELPDDLDLDQLMFNAGIMLRTLLDANIKLLKTRANMKRQLSASLTVVQKEENNPLKFCQSIEEALPYLLFNNSPGFLTGKRAVNESIIDFRAHEMGMMGGIQAAIQATINRFDPAVVENVCEKGRFNQGTKYWDFYKTSYKKISKEAQSDFFGHDFAEAYEKQARAMKNKIGQGNGKKK